jgi:hypothetical protein
MAGNHARARDIMRGAIALFGPADHRYVFPYVDAFRHLAVAEAGLGNFAEATRLLDELLLKYEGTDHPLFVGLLHRTRAEVALAMGDRETFERHLAAMERHFRGTKAPALIAQWERLAELGVRRGLRTAQKGSDDAEARVLTAFTGQTAIRQILSECRGPGERWQRAVELLVSRTNAAAGYLFLRRSGGVELVAATAGPELSDSVRDELVHMIEEARQRIARELEAVATRTDAAPSGVVAASEDDDSDDLHTVTTFAGSFERQSGPYRLLVLSALAGGHRSILGGAALSMDTRAENAVSVDYLDVIARALHDAGDVSSAEALV